ncbi:hypothetical protein diail_11371 [Diaporthe ilicicola]|nr:hypothetical protein diail_11371 [Diaporthe ilicicola]
METRCDNTVALEKVNGSGLARISTPPQGSQTLNRLVPFSIGSFGPTGSHFAQFANKSDFRWRCQRLTFGIPEEV